MLLLRRLKTMTPDAVTEEVKIRLRDEVAQASNQMKWSFSLNQKVYHVISAMLTICEPETFKDRT
jgi:hypothetical protein